jgi:hypothetical protein
VHDDIEPRRCERLSRLIRHVGRRREHERKHRAERDADLAPRDSPHLPEKLAGLAVEAGVRRVEANNYANSLIDLQRFEEAKSLMRKTMPVARRVLGSNDEGTLRTRTLYAAALHRADGAKLDDLREAVTTLQDAERTARRVLGGAHPLTEGVGFYLRDARDALRARETPPSPPSSESV